MVAVDVGPVEVPVGETGEHFDREAAVQVHPRVVAHVGAEVREGDVDEMQFPRLHAPEHLGREVAAERPDLDADRPLVQPVEDLGPRFQHPAAVQQGLGQRRGRTRGGGGHQSEQPIDDLHGLRQGPPDPEFCTRKHLWMGPANDDRKGEHRGHSRKRSNAPIVSLAVVLQRQAHRRGARLDQAQSR
jgi:hypothetical protein